MVKTLPDLVDVRVARGASRLDRRMPGWHNRIDLERFDISYAEDCLIGQLVGDYNKHPEARMKGGSITNGLVPSRGVPGGRSYEEEVQLLNEAWKEAILRRRQVVTRSERGRVREFLSRCLAF